MTIERLVVPGICLMVLGSMATSASIPTATRGSTASAADTIHVAPPTGQETADRASIVAALERVQPGGTMQFARGTYLVGQLIPVPIPRITLLGHPDGTVLRGCEPDVYEEMERQSIRAFTSPDPAVSWALVSRCGMLELTGGHVTIRNLTFELSRLGLLLGCCHAEDVLRPSEGGYRIEGNTFRNSGNSIRGLLSSPDSTVIRGNRFSNVFHALSAQVSHFHVLDNDITVPEPARILGAGHPGFAIGIGGRPRGTHGTEMPVDSLCAHNIISGNRIDGHPDGILVLAGQQGGCRHNIIRDNTIAVRRVRYPVPWPLAALLPLTNEADSTFVGVPVGLLNGTMMSGATAGERQAVIEDNLIEGNRILGGEGLGIEILRASRNRIVNNTISRISRRDPYPGNTLGATQEWREANGSGIWVSPGSTANQITDNTFESVASHAIVLEGDSNRVELRSASDSVHDPGSGNRVTRRNGGIEADATSSRRSLQTRLPRALKSRSSAAR